MSRDRPTRLRRRRFARVRPVCCPSKRMNDAAMRILLCNFEYPPLGGGGGVASSMLAEELAKSHQVTVLTSGRSDQPNEAKENGVSVIRVPVQFRHQRATASLLSMLSYMVRAIPVGRRLLAIGTYDVVNTHFVLPTGPVGDSLSRFAGIPNVVSLHGGDLYDPTKWTSPHRHAPLRAWVRALLQRADWVVGQSTNTLDNMRKYYAPDVAAVRIPLGIKRPSCGDGRRVDYGADDDDIVLVTIGRLVVRKAVDQLIDMVKRLSMLKARLLVIGAGPLELKLRQQCAALGVESHVRFLGQIDEREKFRVLRASDIFVSTSQHEGFGLVFLEAMACGLPVISYDHGGQTDFLRDGATGFLIPLNDLNKFVEGCRLLSDNAARRRAIGQGNLRLVEEYFIDRCAARYEEVYLAATRSHRQRNGAHGHVRRI